MIETDSLPAATETAAEAPAPLAPEVGEVAAALVDALPAPAVAHAERMDAASMTSGGSPDTPWRRSSLASALLTLDLLPAEALAHARAWNAWIMEGPGEEDQRARADLASVATTRNVTCRFNPAVAAELADIAAWCTESAAA